MIENILQYLQKNDYKLSYECLRSEHQAKISIKRDKLSKSQNDGNLDSKLSFFEENTPQTILEHFNRLECSIKNLKNAGGKLLTLVKEMTSHYVNYQKKDISKEFILKLQQFQQYFESIRQPGLKYLSETDKIKLIDDNIQRNFIEANIISNFNYIKFLSDETQDKPQFVLLLTMNEILKHTEPLLQQQNSDFLLSISSILASTNDGQVYLQKINFQNSINFFFNQKLSIFQKLDPDTYLFNYFITILKKLSKNTYFQPFLQIQQIFTLLKDKTNLSDFGLSYLAQIIYNQKLEDQYIDSLKQILVSELLKDIAKKILLKKLSTLCLDEIIVQPILDKNKQLQDFYLNIQNVEFKEQIIFEKFEGEEY